MERKEARTASKKVLTGAQAWSPAWSGYGGGSVEGGDTEEEGT